MLHLSPPSFLTVPLNGIISLHESFLIGTILLVHTQRALPFDIASYTRFRQLSYCKGSTSKSMEQ